MDKRERDSKLVRSFLKDGFEYKGITYKSLTARSLILLERVKSPFFTGGDQLRGILDYLFISSHDSKTILDIIANDEWDETLLDYADTFSSTDLEELSQIINVQNEDASACLVEVREGTGKDSKKK